MGLSKKIMVFMESKTEAQLCGLFSDRKLGGLGISLDRASLSFRLIL